MKKLAYTLALLFVAFWACNDDNEPHYYNVPGVSMVEDYTDPRDGKIYKCIEIGDQIWLAENLAYDLGELETNINCRTFGEEYFYMSIDSVKVSPDACITAALADIENGILEDEAYEFYGMVFWTASQILPDLIGQFSDMPSLVSYVGTSMLLPATAEALNNYPSQLAGSVLADTLANIRTNAEYMNDHYSETYGLLYSYDGALASVPTEGGWRIPTEEDWANLERHLGMAESEIARENAWRGTTEGALLKAGEHGIGFDALFAGGKMYNPTYQSQTDEDLYSRQGQNAYFWSSERHADTDTTSLGVIRSVAVFSDQILKTTTRIVNEDNQPVLFSVRLVKDKN